MSSNNVFCRLSTSDQENWIEARGTDKGFAIYLWNQDWVNPPRLKTEVTAPYSWREFGKFLRGGLDEGWVDLNFSHPATITASGENGVRAHALKLAWGYELTSSSFLDFILTQAEASLDILDRLLNDNELDGFWDETTQEQFEAIQLGEIEDLSEILRLKGKDPATISLEELINVMGRFADECEAAWQGRRRIAAAEREGTLAPYKPFILHLASGFSDEKRRMGAGMSGSKPSEQEVMIHWLENYVLETASLPRGVLKVSIPFLGGEISVGNINFLSDTECRRVPGPKP